MGKVKQGVTSDGEPQGVFMSDDDYKALTYQRYNCIDEKSGRVDEVDYDYVTTHTRQSRGKTTKAEYYAFVENTFADMLTLIKRKNADYTAGADDAFANFRRSEPKIAALDGAWNRWGDKVQRVDAFFFNGKLEVANEGLEDALLDIIGYSVVMLGLLKETDK